MIKLVERRLDELSKTPIEVDHEEASPDVPYLGNKAKNMERKVSMPSCND